MSPSISLAASNHPGPRRPLGLGPASPLGFLAMGATAGGGTALPAGMQGEVAQRILEDLKAVERGHAARAADDTLRRRVQAIKAYQQRRFENSYADLLAERRYAAAVGFFVDELHGPQDFAERQAQIAGIVPTLVWMFPREVVDTVATLVALHALSESLDAEMGRRLRSDSVTPKRYVAAWRATGRADDRRRQIDLTLAVGRRLDLHTRDPLLRSSLRMMRGPALLAGLGELQHFLESGFEAFGSMRGAARFIAAIEQREGALNAALSGTGGLDGGALDQLLPPVA
jgi:hypothetical protein